MRSGYISEIFCSFQGEGTAVGKRHLFIRTAGCHLRCRYCDTPESLERTEAMTVHGRQGHFTLANPVTAEDVVREVVGLIDREGPIDGIALTGGEPLVQSEFLADLLQSPFIPRPRLLETSGTHADRLATVIGLVDIVSMDVKLPSNTGERAFWDEHERFLRVAGAKAYVKILVDSGTENTDVERAAQLVRQSAPNAAVFLQPITRGDGGLDITQTKLDSFFDQARHHVGDVRVLPQMHKFLRIP